MAPMPSEEKDHPHLAEGGRVGVRGRARVFGCVSEPEWERVLWCFGALVLCIKPTSSLPVPQIPILSYETNYG